MAKLPYKISARATIYFGREGVSNANGALVELVKNTYDADADFCLLSFQKDCIYILDNGIGMNQDVIENHWMLIGTDHKKQEYVSAKNRIRVGEKGIGRFALDKLGSACTMFTKNEANKNVYRWRTNWTDFEEEGKVLNEINADLDLMEEPFANFIPSEIKEGLEKIKLGEPEYSDFINLSHGTLFIIENLREQWDKRSIIKISESLKTLLPQRHKETFIIILNPYFDNRYEIVENEFSDEFDYEIRAMFFDNTMNIRIIRNEYDINLIPDKIFEEKLFQNFPFTKEVFEKGYYDRKIPIEELLRLDEKSEEQKRIISQIGKFAFTITFMKLVMQKGSKETFYYKEIGRNRKTWMEEHRGIKIYRDGFLVRPYGDPSSDSFDWLGLDARAAGSPAGVGHASGSWKVRSSQVLGDVEISRIHNVKFIDLANRESIIENSYFSTFKEIIIKTISLFEKDRTEISQAFRNYNKEVSNSIQVIKEGKLLADRLLKDELYHSRTKQQMEQDVKLLAATVKEFHSEQMDLMTDIKLLRALSTSGLLVSTIFHDIKGMIPDIKTRVEAMRRWINLGEMETLDRYLGDMKKKDKYISTWLSIVTNQVKKSKRAAPKVKASNVIRKAVENMRPILEEKMINISFSSDHTDAERKIFIADLETIIYNLILNSIEAFRHAHVISRNIIVSVEPMHGWTVINYKDNGPGLAKKYHDNPYEIFRFGETSKVNKEGNPEGTGLGMYIIASTLREYNAKYEIQEIHNGFELEISIPINMG